MKRLELDTFLKYKHLSDLEVSPDKEQLSFVETVANYDANNYNHKLYLSDGKDHKEILSLNQDARYMWEDDNNILYFGGDSEADKKTKELMNTLVYRYNIKDKEKSLAYKFDIPVSKIEVLNKSELLIISSLSINDHKLLEDEIVRQNYINDQSKESNYHIIDEVPFQFNGSGFINNKRSQAFIYNVDAKTYLPLVDKNTNFGQYEIDKDVIYFTSSIATGVPTFYDDINKYIVTSKVKEVLYNKNDISVSSLIPLKDELYILADDKQSHGINQNPDFYKLSDNTLEKVLIFGVSSHNSVGADVRFGSYTSARFIDDKYFFIGTLNDSTCIYSFDGKELETYFNPKGSIDTFIDFKDKTYLIGLFNNTIQELYTANIRKQDVKLVSDFNQELLKDTYIAKPIQHQFETE